MFLRAHMYVRQSALSDLDAQKVAIMSLYEHVLVPAGYTLGFLFTDPPAQRNKPFLHRDGAVQFLGECREDEVLIVASLANAFTNHADFVKTCERLESRGVTLHVASENDPPVNGAIADMRAELLADLARAETQRASERAIERFEKCRRQGKAIGKPPLGMKWAGAFGRRRLVPDKKDGAVMDRIRQMASRGMSLDRIYFALLASRITRSNGREWSRTTISNVVQMNRTP